MTLAPASSSDHFDNVHSRSSACTKSTNGRDSSSCSLWPSTRCQAGFKRLKYPWLATHNISSDRLKKRSRSAAALRRSLTLLLITAKPATLSARVTAPTRDSQTEMSPSSDIYEV